MSEVHAFLRRWQHTDMITLICMLLHLFSKFKSVSHITMITLSIKYLKLLTIEYLSSMLLLVPAT